MTEIAKEGRFSLDEMVSALADSGLLRMEGQEQKKQIKRVIPGSGKSGQRCYAIRSSAILKWSNERSAIAEPDSTSASSPA
jgi:hypothetical protein